MSLYRTILKQSWQLTWRNKYLWIFGVFAALLGNGGELEILFNNIGANPGQALFPSWHRAIPSGLFSGQTLSNIGLLLKQDTFNIILLLLACLIMLAVFIFLVWLVVVSQAALVNNSAALINQKKVAFKDGLNAGILNFWPVLALNIILKAAVYILMALIALPLILSGGNFAANIFYAVALVIMVPVAIVMSFIMKYAIAYVVINGSGIFEAIKRSWLLFGRNWLISFEMAVILFLINLLAGLVIILVVLTLAVPFLFLGLIFYYSFSLAGSWLIAALAFASFLIIVVTLGAALAVFQIASWTGLFLELDKRGGVSKISRMVGNIVK
ncbi:MAG: hypothetical protein Q8O93_04900 [bacterium]|nr:hypothetical protein [bacterium]